MGPAKDGVQPGNNLFSKGQKIVSDKYRKEYDRIFRKKETKDSK